MLSVVIITLNEEARIRDCLESVKWADEIVVVDSYSQDGTVEIAKEYTSKVYQHKFLGDGPQKNLAIGKTSGDWIFLIDADERSTAALNKEIQETLKSPQYDGYYIRRKAYFLGKWIKHCGWWPDYVLRLFRKDKGRYNNNLGHGRVELKGKTSQLKKTMLHYTCTDLGDFIARINARTTTMAQGNQRPTSLMKCLCHGWSRFIKTYFVKAGFLDGKEGLIISVIASYDVLLKYLKLWEKGRTKCVEMKEQQK